MCWSKKVRPCKDRETFGTGFTFRTETDREEFRAAPIALQYRVESSPSNNNSEFPNGICIVRFQSVKPSELDDAVIELFRLAKKYCGDYDGWETQVISQ